MNSALAEAWLALAGTLRLARGDPGGLDCFDWSVGGFWRSFRAAILCYPLYLILFTFPVVLGGTPVVEVDAGRFYAVESIHFVMSWVAFPLIVLPIADFFGRGDRFLIFVTAYNWCQVPQTMVFAVVAVLAGAGLAARPTEDGSPRSGIAARPGRSGGGRVDRARRARWRRRQGSTDRGRPASKCPPCCAPDGAGTSAPVPRCGSRCCAASPPAHPRS